MGGGGFGGTQVNFVAVVSGHGLHLGGHVGVHALHEVPALGGVLLGLLRALLHMLCHMSFLQLLIGNAGSPAWSCPANCQGFGVVWDSFGGLWVICGVLWGYGLLCGGVAGCIGVF